MQIPKLPHLQVLFAKNLGFVIGSVSSFWLVGGFLARLDEVQEELLYYPGVGFSVGVGGGVYGKVFYVMGKGLSGELSCLCGRSCWSPTSGLVGDLKSPASELLRY